MKEKNSSAKQGDMGKLGADLVSAKESLTIQDFVQSRSEKHSEETRDREPSLMQK